MRQKIKRPKALVMSSFRYGIYLAAEVASDYDKTNSHPYLVSECIMGKLNLLNGKPRKNKDAALVNAIISDLERRVASVEGMMRFMKGVEKFRAKRARLP